MSPAEIWKRSDSGSHLKKHAIMPSDYNNIRIMILRTLLEFKGLEEPLGLKTMGPYSEV